MRLSTLSQTRKVTLAAFIPFMESREKQLVHEELLLVPLDQRWPLLSQRINLSNSLIVRRLGRQRSKRRGGKRGEVFRPTRPILGNEESMRT